MSLAARLRTPAIFLLATAFLSLPALASMPVPFAFVQSLVKKFTFDAKTADATDPPVRAFSAGAGLGTAVSISSDQSTIIVGALNDATDGSGQNYQTNSGAAYIYVKSGGNWVLQQKIAATGTNARNGGDYYGYAVSVDGDIAIVGAPLHSYDASGANGLSQAGAAFVYTRSGTTWSLQQKIVATGTNARNASDYFGGAVGVTASTSTAVIGSYQHPYDASGANAMTSAGAAWVFTRSGSTWSLQQKLVGAGTNGRNFYDQFGFQVAIDTDTIAISANGQQYDASGANALTGAGAVYVFTRSGSAWSLQQKLVPTGTNSRVASDYFGSSLSLNADTVVAGSTTHAYDASGANSVSNAGAAFVFTRSGSTWSQQQILVASGTNGRIAGNQFGGSVGVNGNTIIVGAKYQQYDASGANIVSNAGAAFIFSRSGSTWSQQQKIVGTGTNGRVSGDNTGTAVAVSGTVAVATAPNQTYDASGANSLSAAGAAFVNEYSGSSWSQTGKLTDTLDPAVRSYSSGAFYGFSVAMSSDESTLVVGAPYESLDASGMNYLSQAGAVYVYAKSGGVWTLQQKIVATGTNARQANGYFGYSVAISGNTLVAGALGDAYDASGANSQSNAGAAYVFTRSGSTWSLQQKIVATGTNGRVSGDNFGFSASIDTDTVIVGAPYASYDASGANSVSGAGSAFVYTRSGTTWSQQQKLVATGTNARNSSDSFGYSVAISVDTTVIGAKNHAYDASGANSAPYAGAAFVYTRSAGTWSLQQKLVGTGTNGRPGNDAFGSSVSIDTDTIAIGSPNHSYDANGANSVSNAGAAYIFVRSGSTWNIQQKLVGVGVNGRNSSDAFGSSVSVSGNAVLIGANGQAYDASGANYLLSSGAAFVFTRSGSAWSFNSKLVGQGTNGRQASDYFGGAAALAGSTAAIAAYGQSYDSSGANMQSNAGATYIFSKKP